MCVLVGNRLTDDSRGITKRIWPLYPIFYMNGFWYIRSTASNSYALREFSEEIASLDTARSSVTVITAF